MLMFRKDPFDGVHSCGAVKEGDESDVVMERNDADLFPGDPCWDQRTSEQSGLRREVTRFEP
jgi:hypothetical protein